MRRRLGLPPTVKGVCLAPPLLLHILAVPLLLLAHCLGIEVVAAEVGRGAGRGLAGLSRAGVHARLALARQGPTLLEGRREQQRAGRQQAAHMMNGPSRMESQRKEKSQRTMTQNAPV